MIKCLQLPINMSEFWKAFLPSFIATILGVGLATLGAIWTNNKVIAQTEKAKRKEEVVKLVRSLTVIKEALTFNNEHFLNMLQLHKNDNSIFYFRCDDSTWDVVKNDVVQYLHNPALQRRIAYHFSLIKELRKIEAIYLDSSVGAIASLQHGQAPLKQVIGTHIPEIIQELIDEADILIQQINSVQAKI